MAQAPTLPASGAWAPASEAVNTHRSSWRRMALVTDKDWVRHGASAFGWLAPGELRLFEPPERDTARAWLAETPSD
jgi:hypothetical protein